MGKDAKATRKICVVICTLIFSYPLELISQTTTNILFSGARQTWVVPDGIQSLSFVVEGAQGGNYGQLNSGFGGRISGTLFVTNGMVLNLYVGGQGAITNPYTGGWNGGGKASASSDVPGGTGGGASDIRIGGTSVTNRVIVAGGGGGAGAGAGGAGGAGGGVTAGSGVTGQAGGGFGGTSSAGGAAGGGYGGGGNGATGISVSGGIGGSGYYGGGGGGGGWYGGGGGGGDSDLTGYDGGGGGGGSSYASPTRTTNVVHVQGARPGHGQITLTYISPTAPSNTSWPILSGFPRTGQVLTSGDGTWSSPTALTYRYQWQNSPATNGLWSNATGAGNSTASYTVSTNDVGLFLRVEVTASNSYGTASASSQPTSVVLPLAPANSVVPAISGTIRVDENVSVSAGTWSPTNPTLSFSYQWRVSGSVSGPWTSAVGVGGTTASYQIPPEEVGRYLQAQVTAVNAGGANVAVSASTTPVSKGTQQILFGALPSKTYGDASFAAGASSTKGLAISYASSNPSVAIVVNGEIQILGAGTTTITASQAGNDSYEAAVSVPQDLVVSPAPLTIAAQDKSKVFAEPSNPDPALTFTVSGLVNGETTDVITPITIGRVAGENAGTYAISTTGGTSTNYTSNRTSGTFTIAKASPTISISPDVIPTKTFEDLPFQLTATHSAGLPVTWSSSVTGVATVNTSGLVTITGTGSTVISASHAGNLNYNGVSISRNLTVSSTQPTIAFSSIPTKTYGETNFFLSATSSAGLPLFYRSASTNVATVNFSNGLVTIRGTGTSVMSASNYASTNYQAATNSQMLTVNKSLLMVTASNVTRAYGQTNPSLPFSVTGFVYGETTNVLSSQP